MSQRKMMQSMEKLDVHIARQRIEQFISLDAKMQNRHLNNMVPTAMERLRDDLNIVMRHDKKDLSSMIKMIDDKLVEAAKLQAEANAAVAKMQQEQKERAQAAKNLPAEIKQTKADYSAFMIMRKDDKLQNENDNMKKLMEALAQDPDRLSRLESEISRRNPDSAKAKPILESLQAAKEKFSLSASGQDKISSEDLERPLNKSGLTRSG